MSWYVAKSTTSEAAKMIAILIYPPSVNLQQFTPTHAQRIPYVTRHLPLIDILHQPFDLVLPAEFFSDFEGHPLFEKFNDQNFWAILIRHAIWLDLQYVEVWFMLFLYGFSYEKRKHLTGLTRHLPRLLATYKGKLDKNWFFSSVWILN